jgi:hypothetical protein
MNALETLPDTAAIQTLKEALSKLPQAELITNHYFADGMYCREVIRPAGTLIVGKIHKREHFYIILSGEVTVSGDGYRERIKAPRILVSAPGTQRAVFAHEDTRCITVHRTDSRDLDVIERELIEPDETALFDSHNKLKAPALEQS